MNLMFSYFTLLLAFLTGTTGKECTDSKRWCPRYSCNSEFVRARCQKKCGTCPTPPPGPSTSVLDCGRMGIKNPTYPSDSMEVEKGNFPWQAALYQDGKFFCGGIIVSKKHVLTSASCLASVNADIENMKVVLGDHDLTTQEDTEQTIAVKTIINHGSYVYPEKDNDIAILELANIFKYSKYASQICLPNQDEEVKPGTKCIMTGWGREYPKPKVSDKLKFAGVPIVSNTSCKKRNDNNMMKVTDKMVCTGWDNGVNKMSSCHGDNGGPVACFNGDFWMSYGIISWGSSVCDGTEMYTVSTKISAYKSWLDGHLNLLPTI